MPSKIAVNPSAYLCIYFIDTYICMFVYIPVQNLMTNFFRSSAYLQELIHFRHQQLLAFMDDSLFVYHSTGPCKVISFQYTLVLGYGYILEAFDFEALGKWNFLMTNFRCSSCFQLLGC